MLPQLKWRTLNDADINQIPFGAKKRSFKCDYRGFGGLEGSQCCRFFGGPQSNTYFFKNKKNMVYVLWVHQIQLIFEFYDDFCLHYLNFRWPEDMLENRFSVKLQRAPKPWWGGGDPKIFSGRVPQQHLTPQNTDKYVRTSGTGPKLGNKIFSEKKPERNLKNTKVSYACADVPDVCTYHFLLQIASRDIFTS